MSGPEALLLGTLLLLFISPGFLETSPYFYSEVIIPKMLHRRPGSGTEKEISYLIKIEGINQIVHLRQKSFITANMPFYTFNTKGERQVDHPYIQDNCYYSGFVEDIPDSDVVLSTCIGLWGHIQIERLMYEIQPVQNSTTFQHLVYLTAPEQHVPCAGTLEDQDGLERKKRRSANANRGAADAFARSSRDPVDAPRYLEYYVVCDSSMYQQESRNETRLMLQMLQIVSVLHNIYKEIGLHIILVGMEVWTEQDFSVVSQKKLGRTLESFYHYATFELQRHVHFDHATIYTQSGEDPSFGMSWGEQLCLHNQVSVSAVKISLSKTHSGVSAAHELGHSLGFLHDDILGGNTTGCDCNCISKPGHCIMYSGVVECRRLSNCSRKAYHELLEKPGKTCLQNQPKEVAMVKNECGNGIVDGNEECDCGLAEDSEKLAVDTTLSGDNITELQGLSECRRNGCCQSNCKMKPDTNCLYGLCCKECKFVEEGTLCRKAATDCDLPEYCTGASADCPPDVHKQDREWCGTGSTCFRGKCSDLKQHCRAIFGKGAKPAPRSCFKVVNTRGDRTGNCGQGIPGYQSCEEDHSLCGRIQCTNIRKIPVLSTKQAVLQTPLGNIWCWGVEFRKGLGVNDIGATPDGIVCGAGKICLNGSCVPLPVRDQQYSCNASRCNNRGVCNSKHNCHCAYGWAPPFCEGKGYGGSPDSGPPPKHKVPTNVIIGSTIGALCVFLTLALIRKYIILPWWIRRQSEEDSDLDDIKQPIKESQEVEAPPLKKPSKASF